MDEYNKISASNPVNIESFFHDTGKGRVFCTLIGSPNHSEECIIYFSPLFEERMWSHRIAFNFALELAALERQTVLFFDYHGYGESDGDSEDFTLAGCRYDVESLISHMKERGFTSFSWWGIRTGCAVGLATIPSVDSFSSALLWAPVLNMKDFLYDSLRSTIAGQYMIFNKSLVTRDDILEELVTNGGCSREGIVLNFIEGYRFGRAFYLETRDMDNASSLSLISCPALVLELLRSGAKGGNTVAKPSRICESAKGNPNISYLQVAERPFWVIGKDYSQRAEALYNATFDWLAEHNQ